MSVDTVCGWAVGSELERQYHDQEWGQPVATEQHLFEMLTLEGAQAGLSWLTVLQKRDRYRQQFAGFDPAVVARFDETHYQALMADAGLIRNKLKIRSTIHNAQVLVIMHEQGRTLAELIWSTVDGQPVDERRQSMADVPAQTVQSAQLSKRLQKAGFRFVGPTTCYSLMQACGLVNDHLLSCPAHAQCQALAADFQPL